MTRFQHVRVAVAAIGIIVWGYGLRSDDDRVRLVGIAVLAISLILRFVPKRLQQDDNEST